MLMGQNCNMEASASTRDLSRDNAEGSDYYGPAS